MPELPEVESARRLVERNCVGYKIRSVNVYEQGNGPRNGLFDDIVYETKIVENAGDIKDSDYFDSNVLKPSHYEKALVNQIINKVHRKGKQLWFELRVSSRSSTTIDIGSSFILFHFGMTGSFVVKGVDAPSYMSFKVRDEIWPPKFTKFEIIFENNIQLAFTDPRRLGRIRLRNEDLMSHLPISKLAMDPIINENEFTIEYFKSSLAKYTCPIKALLLDQEKVICGIGNW